MNDRFPIASSGGSVKHPIHALQQTEHGSPKAATKSQCFRRILSAGCKSPFWVVDVLIV